MRLRRESLTERYPEKIGFVIVWSGKHNVAVCGTAETSEGGRNMMMRDPLAMKTMRSFCALLVLCLIAPHGIAAESVLPPSTAVSSAAPALAAGSEKNEGTEPRGTAGVYHVGQQTFFELTFPKVESAKATNGKSPQASVPPPKEEWLTKRIRATVVKHRILGDVQLARFIVDLADSDGQVLRECLFAGSIIIQPDKCRTHAVGAYCLS